MVEVQSPRIKYFSSYSSLHFPALNVFWVLNLASYVTLHKILAKKKIQVRSSPTRDNIVRFYYHMKFSTLNSLGSKKICVVLFCKVVSFSVATLIKKVGACLPEEKYLVISLK